MPSYKFDQHLVPSVLTDQVFQSTGIYTGNDAGVFYAVIDPRRHNISVWRKTQQNPHVAGRDYRISAIRLGSHFFTNGPMMAPPIGNGRFAQVFFIIFPFPWRPFDRVISGGRLIAVGKGITKSFFSRIGQGSFASYTIGYGRLPPGINEGLSGLVRLVANGAIVNDADTPGINGAVGIASWGLCPITPVPTDGWSSEVPYFDEADEDVLDGLIIAAATQNLGFNAWMAMGMKTVGCTEAVAMDGSDSVICGTGNVLNISCTALKDDIQRWGLGCF